MSSSLAALPRAAARRRAVRGRRRLLDALAARLALLPLVRAVTSRAKRARGRIDFGDQMAIAAQVAGQLAEVGARSSGPGTRPCCWTSTRTPAHAQLDDAARPVRRRAPGDRGRRPGPVDLRLARREREQPGPLRHRTSARRRRPGAGAAAVDAVPQRRAILDVGQRLSAEPLRAARWRRCRALRARRRRRGRRASRSRSPTTVAGRGRLGRRSVRDGVARPAGGRPAAAAPRCWCRRRSQFTCSPARCGTRGVPVELVGLGGLLTTPEVVDVVSTLRVLGDPTPARRWCGCSPAPAGGSAPRDLAALGRGPGDAASG